ncbi:MAG: hypothetical protein QOJ00_2605 [Actinomycetota bacterium]|jgi:endonuclease/exonuclease/phosphatase family metal-dependent hydrolase
MERNVLRVGSFNVRNARAFDGLNSWPFRRRTTARVAASLRADLLGVQEAYGCQVRYLVTHGGDVRAFGDGRGTNRSGEHCAVLVSSSIDVVEHHTRWFGDTPDTPGTRLEGASFPRIATTVVVNNHGAPLSFTNTHLDQRSSKLRRRSVTQLLEWLDLAQPQVIVGDFNAAPDDALFDTLADARFRNAFPPNAPGTFHGFTGTAHGPPIDFILVNEHVEVVDARVVVREPGARLASDHWPLVADLTTR